MPAATGMAARLTGGLAGLATLAALLSGCGDDEPTTPSETGSVQQPSDSAPTDGGAPTGDPTADPTGGESTESSSEPSSTPATGLVLREETSQLRAPEGDWQRIPDIVSYATAVGSSATGEVISLSDRENFSGLEASLDEQVRFHNDSLPPDAIIKRQPDVLLDGEPAYYVQWFTKGDTKLQHDIGIDRLGQVVEIQMDLRRDDPASGAAIVEAVVASFEWR